jgi:hypothetical protein
LPAGAVSFVFVKAVLPPPLALMRSVLAAAWTSPFAAVAATGASASAASGRRERVRLLMAADTHGR